MTKNLTRGVRFLTFDIVIFIINIFLEKKRNAVRKGNVRSGEKMKRRSIIRKVCTESGVLSGRGRGRGREVLMIWGRGGGGGGLDVNFDLEKTELSFSELKPK